MGKGFLKGAAIGAILGAAAAFLMAPKSGKEMREQIKKMVSDLSKKIHEEAEKAGSLTKESYDRIVDTLVEEYKKGKDMAEDVMNEVKEELKSKWEEVKAEMGKED